MTIYLLGFSRSILWIVNSQIYALKSVLDYWNLKLWTVNYLKCCFKLQPIYTFSLHNSKTVFSHSSCIHRKNNSEITKFWVLFCSTFSPLSFSSFTIIILQRVFFSLSGLFVSSICGQLFAGKLWMKTFSYCNSHILKFNNTKDLK